jgi:hypothetical protein
MNRNFDPTKLTLLLSGILQKQRVKFFYDKDTQQQFSFAGYEPQGGFILVKIGKKLVDVLNNIITDKGYESFVDQVIDQIFAHEVIHKTQFKDLDNDLASKIAAASKKSDTKKYLSAPHELMAFAHDAVKELQNADFSKKEILDAIKHPSILKTNPIFNKRNRVLKHFFDVFDKDDKAYKRFQKYVYQYIQMMY